MKRWKAMGAWLLCLLLLLSLPAPSRAQEEAESVLRVGQAGGRRGDTVTVEVSLTAVNGIAGGSFNIGYDTAALTLVSAEAGEAMSGRLCTVNPHYSEHTVRVSFAGTEPLKGPGVLLRLHFTIRGDAVIGDTAVTAESVKLTDVDAGVVSRQGEDGFVTVQSVALSLSSRECLAGQSAKLEVLLDGPLAPCGGELTLNYDPAFLEAGSVKAEEKLGGSFLTLSSSIDASRGSLRISWAAAVPPESLGTLCTLIFNVKEEATGESAVTFGEVKFYDVSGKAMELSPPQAGKVTVVGQYNPTATLYLVGGSRNEEEQTATVQIAVDGAGLVCGGQFLLAYDTELCTLLEMERMMGCVAVRPETASEAAGSLLVSWAEDSPALDNQAILQLRFRLLTDEAAPLILSETKLVDSLGQSMEDYRVHSGMLGIRAGLQEPIAEIEVAESEVRIEAELYDAEYCTEHPTEAVKLILACYSGDRMLMTEVPEEAVVFDEFGIAHLDLRYSPESGADTVKLFILDAGGMKPMCEKLVIDEF